MGKVTSGCGRHSKEYCDEHQYNRGECEVIDEVTRVNSHQSKSEDPYPELKPCPICDKPGEQRYSDNVNCSSLDCELHFIELSVQDWNTRPSTERAIKLITICQTALKEAFLLISESNEPELVRAGLRTSAKYFKELEKME